MLNFFNTMEKVPKETTLIDKIAQLKASGYMDDFEITENGLHDLQTLKIYNKNEIAIDNVYRFEGDSNPSDTSILYAITTKDGCKGLLMDAYGTYSDNLIDEFIKEVEIKDEKR